MIYRDRLVISRERIGETQRSIANKIGMEESHYRHCEMEDELFPLKRLNDVCNHFDISLDYIFSFNDLKQYKNEIKEIDKTKTGQRLKEFRKENKITQIQLAKLLNIGNGTLAGYEVGNYLISTHVIYTICKKYKISADYLLGKIDEPKYLN